MPEKPRCAKPARAPQARRPETRPTGELVVEERPEQAGRVEPGGAEPVDGPVGGHQRRRLEVTDEAVVGDERVVGHPVSVPSGDPPRLIRRG